MKRDEKHRKPEIGLRVARPDHHPPGRFAYTRCIGIKSHSVEPFSRRPTGLVLRRVNQRCVREP